MKGVIVMMKLVNAQKLIIPEFCMVCGSKKSFLEHNGRTFCAVCGSELVSNEGLNNERW